MARLILPHTPPHPPTTTALDIANAVTSQTKGIHCFKEAIDSIHHLPGSGS